MVDAERTFWRPGFYCQYAYRLVPPMDRDGEKGPIRTERHAIYAGLEFGKRVY